MQIKDDTNNRVTEGGIEAMADMIMFAQRTFLLDLSRELNKGNISYAQFFLLGYLSSEDYLTMTDISKKMGHSTAAATGLVDRLEKLGYVQRLHAADDRRKVMVQITRKGIELVTNLRESIKDMISNILARQENGEEVESIYSDLRGFLTGNSN